MEFQPYPKIARLSRECVVTEKIDGTNAQIYILDNGITMYAGSRNRWLIVGADNHGFAGWVERNADELLKLGPGRHFGEWWGSGIQRGYGLAKGEKRFSLFNTSRWSDPATRPACCEVVPVLYQGPFDTRNINVVLEELRLHGSVAAPDFPNPEGIVIYHTAANICFKKTVEKDASPKGIAA